MLAADSNVALEWWQWCTGKILLDDDRLPRDRLQLLLCPARNFLRFFVAGSAPFPNDLGHEFLQQGLPSENAAFLHTEVETKQRQEQQRGWVTYWAEDTAHIVPEDLNQVTHEPKRVPNVVVSEI